MANPLAEAYAGNTETPILTVEIKHSALTGGVLRLVQGVEDLTATIPSVGGVTFTAAGIDILVPSKDSEGTQQLTINIDNVSNMIYAEMIKIVTANRSSQEEVEVNTRVYIPSDLSAPQQSIPMIASSAAVNTTTARISAIFAPLYDNFFPRLKYYPNAYHGVKYA